jgi:hypothetical protein
MAKRIAIVQSNYIPWKGYFDLIAASDEFILFDDMQYTRRDWRNRNQIKTPDGLQWLTVPVKVKGKFDQAIRDTEIDGHDWIPQHLRALQHSYGKCSHYHEVMAILAPVYHQQHTHLSALNRALIESICGYLGIKTRIRNSWDYTLQGDKSARLLHLVKQAGGSIYISGPAAKDYLDESIFTAENIAVEWFSYDGYREYPQRFGDFTHHVSVVDLLFHCGTSAADYMKYVKPGGQA